MFLSSSTDYRGSCGSLSSKKIPKDGRSEAASINETLTAGKRINCELSTYILYRNGLSRIENWN